MNIINNYLLLNSVTPKILQSKNKYTITAFIYFYSILVFFVFNGISTFVGYLMPKLFS